MEKELVKQAIAAAEQEQQDKKVKEIKSVFLAYLDKIENKKRERDELKSKLREKDEEIDLLKKDVDDLKAGRLDKIEERQLKDPAALRIAVVIVRRIPEYYIPMYPWKSPFEFTWQYVPGYPSITVSGTSNYVSVSDSYSGSGTLQLTGTQCSTFGSGAYNTATGGTINL